MLHCNVVYLIPIHDAKSHCDISKPEENKIRQSLGENRSTILRNTRSSFPERWEKPLWAVTFMYMLKLYTLIINEKMRLPFVQYSDLLYIGAL
jgi:hypothetical protein